MADPALKGWVQRTIAEMLLMEVGQAEELASCLLAMPVGSAKQDGEVLQFLRDFLGDTPAVTAFGQEVIAQRKGTKKDPLPSPSAPAAPQQQKQPQSQPKPQPQAQQPQPTSSTSSLGKGTATTGTSSTAAMQPKAKPFSSTSLATAAEDFWGAPVPAPAARAPSPSLAPAPAPAPAPPVAPAGGSDKGGKKQQQPPPPKQQQQQQPKQQQQQQGGGNGKGKGKEGANKKPSSLGASAFGGGGGGGGGGATKKAQPPPPRPGLEAGGKGGGGGVGEGKGPAAAATPSCGCMGAVHKPLGNCLTCGRVACEVEGWQRCAFCKCLLTDPTVGYRSRPPQTLKRDIQAAAARAAKQPPSHGAYGQRYEDAVALREKLLMFDQTMVERSRVFDDQADYYQNTDWLSQEEKERLEAQEEARREAMDRRRREVAVTFDIAGRRVIVEQDPSDPFATPSSLQPTTPTPASGFDPAVDVAHGLSEGAARRLGGRGEGEGLPVAASHGAAQLSGRAREVYESLTAHYAKVVAKAQKKKKAQAAAAAAAAQEEEEEDGSVPPHSLRLQHEEEAVPDDDEVDVDYLMATA